MLKLGDILIIAGVVLIPLSFSILAALAWLRNGPGHDNAFFAISSGLISGALGLVTEGILIKRNSQ